MSHYVYRLHDKHGEVIYIGMTANVTARMRHHTSDFINPWARYVDHWTTEEYPDAAAAHDAEIEAIAAECPPFNVNHTPTRDRDREAEYRARYDARKPAPTTDLAAMLADLFPAST